MRHSNTSAVGSILGGAIGVLVGILPGYFLLVFIFGHNGQEVVGAVGGALIGLGFGFALGGDLERRFRKLSPGQPAWRNLKLVLSAARSSLGRIIVPSLATAFFVLLECRFMTLGLLASMTGAFIFGTIIGWDYTACHRDKHRFRCCDAIYLQRSRYLWI